MKKNYILLFIFLLSTHFVITAQNGGALNFDGIDDQVDCGNDTSVQISGTAITLEARVKVDVFDSAGVFADNVINKLGTGTNGYALRLGGPGALNFIFGNGSVWTEFNSPDNTLETEVWYHIAATYDGAMMRIYVDGTEVASLASSESITVSPEPLRIGESGFPGRNFDGSIDEVRIWNIVRTPEEINANQETELSLPQDNLVAYYQFNQGIDGGDNTGETTLIDALGVNNGTLLNFALIGDSSNWVRDSFLSTEDFGLHTVSVFPNPVQDNIHVEGLLKSTEYVIYNTLGQKISEGTIFQNGINVSEFKQGLYILNLESLGNVKFIKE